MSFPVKPSKSTSGIIVDPETLERVVPSSKRLDGTERKVLKIRPGFTPVEDIARYRPARALEASSSRGSIPGSIIRSSPASTSQKESPVRNNGGDSNPFKALETSAAEKGRAQAKNAKRREKRRVAGGSEDVIGDHDDEPEVEEVEVEKNSVGGLRQDEVDDKGDERVKGDDDEVDKAINQLGALSIGGGGAPIEGVSTKTSINTAYASVPAYTGPSKPPPPTDPVTSIPPPAAAIDSEVGASSLVSSEKTERDWKAAKLPPTGSEADRGWKGMQGGPPPGFERGRGGPPPGFGGGRGGPPPGFERGRGGSTGSPAGKAPPGFERGRGGSFTSGAGRGSPRSQPGPRDRPDMRPRGGVGSLADQVKGLLVGDESQGKRVPEVRKNGADSNGDWRSKA